MSSAVFIRFLRKAQLSVMIAFASCAISVMENIDFVMKERAIYRSARSVK